MEAKLTGIDRQEVLRYLSFRSGVIPLDLEEELSHCREELMRIARPRAVWKLFDLAEDGSLLQTNFKPAGKDIRKHLQDCTHVILMAATLGMETEQLLRREQLRDMGHALVLDATASAGIENVCDNLCADLREAMAPLHLTERFSPGYGDLPLDQQKELFQTLDVSRKIGVMLSESGLMIPQKSVTALVGVSHKAQKRRGRDCVDCGLYESCAYRKDGESCGKV